jgi:Glyoxalase-like domain
MTFRFQLVIDCRDPEPLARFWAAALGYEFEPLPEGSQPGTTTGVTSA